MERDNLIDIMKAFINSPSRFLVYDDLCHEIGKDVINSLIACNLIHLRPTKETSFDLEDQEEGVAVVTPETPSGYVAMECIVKRLTA